MRSTVPAGSTSSNMFIVCNEARAVLTAVTRLEEDSIVCRYMCAQLLESRTSHGCASIHKQAGGMWSPHACRLSC